MMKHSALSFRNLNFFLAFVAIIFTTSVFSQDLLVKRNGDIIEVKVLEVNDKNIKYKNYSNLDGPVYSIEIENVLSIKYENGQSDVFVTSEDLEKDRISSNNNNEIQQQVIVNVNGKSSAPPKIVAGLCNIFLSPLGIGHFIVGQVGRGVLDIIFFWTGIPEIVCFIEGVVWLCMPDDRWVAKFGY